MAAQIVTVPRRDRHTNDPLGVFPDLGALCTALLRLQPQPSS
jgi:hypothetical protein